MKKLLNKTFFTFLLATLVVVFGTATVSGQEFTTLTDVPLLFDSVSTENGVDLTTFLSNAFTFLISISSIIAVVIIVVGGFQYLTSDIAGNKSAAKDRIFSAVKGLILILLTWIIMFTINPDTLNFNFFRSSAGNQDFYSSKGYSFNFFKDGEPNKTYPQGPYQTIEQCNEMKSRIESSYGRQKVKVFEDRDCTTRPLEEGDVVWRYFVSEYTEPPVNLTNTNKPSSERNTERIEKFDFSFDMCETKRRTDANRELKTIFIDDAYLQCKEEKIGDDWYFKFNYPDQTGKEFTSPTFYDQPYCIKTMEEMYLDFTEKINASVDRICTEETINEVSGDFDGILYCTDLVMREDERDADALEKCFSSRTQCDAEQNKMEAMEESVYIISSCNEV